MCAQFLIQSRVKDLAAIFGGPLQVIGDIGANIDLRVLPHQLAPIVVRSDEEQLSIQLMNFSLVPSWSKERKVRFATHNARIESVAEKPTWKRPFLKQRCLVPITRFIEPIYLNELAGNMVQFFPESHELMLAAGVWDSWTNRETGEVLQSFAILTNEPPGFIGQVGHDRCPVFLQKSGFEDWLSRDEKSSPVLFDILAKNLDNISWTTQIDRPLAKGWEKRIPKETLSD